MPKWLWWAPFFICWYYLGCITLECTSRFLLLEIKQSLKDCIWLPFTSIHIPVLMLNVDLSKTIACDRQAVFKSAEFCGQFINLTFLSLHFTPQIELNERLEGTESSQKFIQVIFYFCFAIKNKLGIMIKCVFSVLT